MKTIYFQYWTESEAGWGQRPDGFILHLSLEDHKKFLDDYWDKMPKNVPCEYSYPDGPLDRRNGHALPIEVDGRSAIYRDLVTHCNQKGRGRKYGRCFFEFEIRNDPILQALNEKAQASLKAQ